MTDHIKRHDDGKFARHTHSTGGDLSMDSVHPTQVDLAAVTYEPGTTDTERLRFTRTAISANPYSFENIGQDAGEALDAHIQDDAVVLKALDTARDAVDENPSEFGQIIAEQIHDDVSAAEEAKWSAAYHAEKRAPLGRPETGPLDGYDKRPSAGLVNISRRESSHNEDGEQFDGPYDVRDPKHPKYLDRGLSSGRGSHDSRGQWRPGPTQAVSSISLSLDDRGGARYDAAAQTRPPVGVNISLPEFPEDSSAENEAKAKAKDEARRKALAEEGERYREQVRISREAGRGGGNLRQPPQPEWSSGGSRTSLGSSTQAWSPGVSDPQRNAGSHVIR